MAREKAVILQEILVIKDKYLRVVMNDMRLIQYSPDDKSKLEKLETELKQAE
jgi:hypothetical protein